MACLSVNFYFRQGMMKEISMGHLDVDKDDEMLGKSHPYVN